ncbi:MAG: tetratricopeptide repeat protein [Rhodothermaceae bacterium]|nr:tetratricopeptide repeat protein [Rhodothermaceae bacterium]
MAFSGLALGLVLFTIPRLYAQAEGELLAAARSGNVTALEALLNDASPDAADADGATALMWAAHNGHLDAARALVEAGAAVDEIEGVIWMDATQRGYFGSVLGAAIGRGHFALVPFLIEEAGADLDAADWNPHTNARLGWTPLQWAVVIGHEPTVAYLIDRGADLERSLNGGPPLSLALEAGHTGIADLLRAAGADPVIARRYTPPRLPLEGADTDSLTTASDTMDAGSFSNFHLLVLSEARPFEIAVTATAFAPHLLVRSPSGVTLQSDEWPGASTEARVLVGPERTEDGRWGVVVTSRDVGEVGAYRLSHRTLPDEGYERLLAEREVIAQADSLNRQVAVLEAGARYVEAAALAEQELVLREQVHGPNHPLVALSLNNLAALYSSLGRYAEAEPLHIRALAIRTEALGTEHPDVATSLGNLADLYHSQGRYAEAEPFAQRALAIREASLGEEDVDVALSLNNLAAIYVSQGRYAEAEALHRRGLAIYEAALGENHPDLATSLSNLAALAIRQGRYAEALALAERALALREDALGPEHPDVATSLNTLAALYEDLGRYAEAEVLYVRALALVEAALGPGHPDVALALDNLASLYRTVGRYAEAADLAERALAVREQVLGPDHPDTAKSLTNLAALHATRGRYAEAEALYTRTLAIYEAALGPDHPDVAGALSNLADLYMRQGRYAEAEALYARALAIYEATLGSDHPDTARGLNNLAGLYATQARYAEALPLAERALAIWEQALGPEHPEVGRGLNNLAALYARQGRYAEAEPLYTRARGIVEAAKGAEHVEAALALGNLAAFYEGQGRYAEAEPLVEQALTIYEAALGADHPDVATGLNNLAEFYSTQGRYAEAEPLYTRALAIYETALGPDHPDVALALGNLASLDAQQGRFDEARVREERALALRERTMGADHPDVTTSLNNLAVYVAHEGRYAEAEALHRRALAINEAALGASHPDVALSLNNLADLHYTQGRYAEALPLAERALAIRETTLGPTHPHLALTLSSLAGLHLALARFDDASTSFRRAAQIESGFIQEVLPYATEREKEAFLRTRTPVGYQTTAALLAGAPASAQRDAFDLLLQRKALRLDAAAQQRGAVLTGGDATAARLYEDFQALAREIASLTFAGPRNGDPTAYRAHLDALDVRREQIEDSLARRSGVFVRARQVADAGAIAAALPSESHLVEFVRYDVFDFLATEGAPWWKPARYAAFVLAPSSAASPDVRLVDLGAATSIDSLVQRFREQMARFDPLRMGRAQQRRSEARLTALTQALYQRLFQPLALPEEGTLFVSPDGLLHTLPFAILTDEASRPLAGRYRLSYLTSGRDLLRFANAAAADADNDSLYVFAGVDYAAVPDGIVPPDGSFDPSLIAARSRDLREGSFATLPGTDEEAAALQVLYPGQTRLFLGAEATEANLLALHRPGRLHIATHGFFLSTQEEVVRLTGFDDLGNEALVPGGLGRFENPLLRSGLALTGANRLGDDNAVGVQDGIATAYELSGLDLRGTDLVVLSACETGLGEIQNGEGVLGLRRAFELAGAETVVMSLWKVPDVATKELMIAFYRALEAGTGKAEALHEAAQAVRADPRWAHPYWWGAFILAGDPH